MHSITERTPLRRDDSPDYVEFASLLRTRRTRLRQFQCCVCGILIVVFTMALIVSVSYSMSHTNSTTIANDNATSSDNLGDFLRLGFTPEFDSHASFSSTVHVTIEPSSILVSSESTDTSTNRLNHQEYMLGLRAGEQAMKSRKAADMIAAKSLLPSPSPESRHRYAVNTCPNVSILALAAVGEIAATRMIESMRSIHNEPSAIDAFFDSGWVPKNVCRHYFDRNCKIGKYRTFDGTCNRPRHWGSGLTPFRRSLPPDYADGIESPRRARSGKELPSAREVSMKVHGPSPSSNPSFTVMLAVFGQFMDHDITATALSQSINGSSIACCPPSTRHPECFPVRIAIGDPIHNFTGKTCMDFMRSAPAPQCKLSPREQLNQVSAFIDGSAIYGSKKETARNLREFIGGRLRMQLTPDNRTLLPPSRDPNDGCNREAELRRGRYCFATGDARANENLHLITMHLLWARQHNHVADKLARINPFWSDETLYQEARRIVGAQLQHITYREFLPIVLGNERMNRHHLKPLISGYRKYADNDLDNLTNNPTIANHFAAAAFRFAHTLLPGLMKMTDAEKDTPSYTELHKMLFNPYSLYAEDGVKRSVTSATTNFIQKYSTHVTSQLTNHLFEDPLENSTTGCGLDLVSLNIQRGRDHGLPGYTAWRDFCGLGKARAFDDLNGHLDHQALVQISTLYETVDDIDLYTGALAEIPESGSLVGPTFACLIADQFVRLQRGDRYWYESAVQLYPFTEAQLVELRKSSLAKLICDCSDGIANIQMEVMRSVGPDNPMISCEDMPELSFGPWKEDHASHLTSLRYN